MNWSAEEVALVPFAVVTVTSTVPVPAGAVAMIVVGETTCTFALFTAPKATLDDAVKPVPVMSTCVPPEGEPAAGDNDVTLGSTR